MPKGFFNVVYFLGIVGEILIRFPHERKRREQRIVVEDATAREQAVLGSLAIGILLIPLVYALTPFLKRADYSVSERTSKRMGALGSLLFVLGLWLFYRSHADLGRNWSPLLQIREEHELVTDGVYRYLRHPMYTSQLLWVLAQPLLLHNWIAGWSGLPVFLLFPLVRVPHEERMMEAQFGDAYRAYKQRTGGILPTFRR
jgi:protein-S-isoprenylcysteine O-methyltransferase Ste14